MPIEGQFVERWKELEVATRLAFPKWDGRDVAEFLKRMRVEGVDFTRLMALRMARNALAHNPMLNGSPLAAFVCRSVGEGRAHRNVSRDRNGSTCRTVARRPYRLGYCGCI